jgi:hypothetical protein
MGAFLDALGAAGVADADLALMSMENPANLCLP